MTLLHTEKKYSLLLHLTGVLAFLLLPFLTSPQWPRVDHMLYNPVFMRDMVTQVLLIVFFYLNYYRLIPFFFFNGKYVLYTLTIAGCMLLTVVLPALIPMVADRQGLPLPPPPPHHTLINRLLFNHYLYYFLLVFAFSLLLRINSRWKTARQEKTRTELLFLKAQINPHFLFNTLNSVYSLCIEEKASQSASAVLKVSGMMRYVLIDSKQDFVDLEDEINYIKSYIELQRLRFGSTVNIDFTLNGDFRQQKIAPLLLITFIENAFKYGVNPEADSPISIMLTLKGNVLAMKVANNKVALTGNDQKMGIGIATTLKRMELLYASRYQLKVADEHNIYQVLLTLILS